MRKSLLLFILSVSVSYGQQKVITLDQAIGMALERNITVIQAENTLEGQESNRLTTYGDFLPSISASGGWTRTQRDGPIFVQGSTFGGGTSLSNNFSTGVSANVTLFNGFANTANFNRAQSNVNAAGFSLTRTRQQTAFQTTQLYLNVLRTRELLKVREENLKRSEKQLERIQEANKVGSLALADVYRQQVQVGTDRLGLIQAKNDYDKAGADMAFYLALSVIDDYEFTDPAVPSTVDTAEFKTIDDRYSNFNTLVDQAMKVRPDYQSAVESYNAASSGVTVARAGHLPTISAFASYGSTTDSLPLSRIGINKSTQWGISISLPLFSGFRVDNQWQQAKINERNSLEQLQQAERQVQVDIRKALLDFNATKQQIIVAQQTVVSAEQDRRIAEEKYNLGAGTLLDLLVANANYVSAVSNKVNAVYNYYQVKKQLEFSVGTLSY